MSKLTINSKFKGQKKIILIGLFDNKIGHMLID